MKFESSYSPDLSGVTPFVQRFGAEFMLKVNNIQVVYNNVIMVLKGISLEVPEGKSSGPPWGECRGQDHHP